MNQLRQKGGPSGRVHTHIQRLVCQGQVARLYLFNIYIHIYIHELPVTFCILYSLWSSSYYVGFAGDKARPFATGGTIAGCPRQRQRGMCRPCKLLEQDVWSVARDNPLVVSFRHIKKVQVAIILSYKLRERANQNELFIPAHSLLVLLTRKNLRDFVHDQDRRITQGELERVRDVLEHEVTNLKEELRSAVSIGGSLKCGSSFT